MFTNASLILERRRHRFTRQQLGGSILIPKYTTLNKAAHTRPHTFTLKNANNRTAVSKRLLMSSQQEILAHFISLTTLTHE